MIKKTLWIISIIISMLLILTLIFVGCAGPTQTPTSKTLIIGASTPLSGPASIAGLAFKQGWEIAVEEINKDGGIKIGGDTYMLKLVIEDSKGEVTGATTCTTKLCHEEGAKFIFADPADHIIPAAYKVTSEANAMLCQTLRVAAADVPGSNIDIGSNSPLLVRLAPSVSERHQVPIQYLLENYTNIKNIALMGIAFPEYEAQFEYLSSEWAPLGLNVCAHETFAPDVVDFIPIVGRILENKPDVIYNIGSPAEHFILIIKAARDLGFNGPLVCTLTIDPTYLSSAMPNLSDIITVGISMGAPNLPGEIKNVIDLGNAKYGAGNLVGDSLFAYDDLMLLTQIMVKAKSIDPEKVQDTLETLTVSGSLQSIFGPANAGGKKKTGVNRAIAKPLPLSRLVNGTGEFIDMYSIEIP
jgi:branched-chain amino acid transport system substrate-binding protein